MVDFILFKFETDEDTKNRDLKISRDSTMREALLYFLRDTNSILTLELEKIQFMNKAKLLNVPKILDKKVGEHFNRTTQNIKIKVLDAGNILGGIRKLYVK